MQYPLRFLYLSLFLSPLFLSLIQAAPQSGAGARIPATQPFNAGRLRGQVEEQAGIEGLPPGPEPPRGPEGRTPPKEQGQATGGQVTSGQHGNKQISTHNQLETNNHTPESAQQNEGPPRGKNKDGKVPDDGGDPTSHTAQPQQATAAQVDSAAAATTTSQRSTATRAATTSATPGPPSLPPGPAAASDARGAATLLGSKAQDL
ncbi:MAG: hypothetical protein Q9210_007537, partial [Variospora velana]